jgi:acyl-CoA-binding protein
MENKDENELEKKFKKYTEKVKKLNYVTNENKLYLYSHYKQALNGNNINEKPSIFNRIEMEKWKAWLNLENMSKEEAMKNYIKKVKELYKSE